jgi:flagellar biosynthesis GTPase FlhF
MRSGIKLWWIVATVALLGVAYGTWAAIRAHNNWVTLNVRNMDVHKVISKIEWQTQEKIFLDKNVHGKITLNVTRAPLEHVLHIIGEQTSARWGTMYPLYSSSKSYHALERVLRGESDPALVGWTNLQSRGFGGRGGGPGPGFGGPGGPGFGGPGGGPGFGRGGGGMFTDFRTNLNQPITLNIENKDVRFATIALNRFSSTRVVADDHVQKNVTLKLNQVSARDAVARLAKAAGADWDKVYSFRGDDGPREFADRRDGRRGELTDEEREQLRKQREAMEEELRQTMSAEERARMEQARAEREKFFQEMQGLTPEQRRERFQQMGSAMRDQRNLDRIKNTTPEQRLERYREMNQRRQRFQERQNRGDRQTPGQPGPPGQAGQQPPPPPPRQP